MAKIKVKAPGEESRVALWDRDPAHPKGEVYLTGGQTAELEETQGVKAALRDGRLVRLPADAVLEAAAPIAPPAAPVAEPVMEPAADKATKPEPVTAKAKDKDKK